MTGIVQGKLNEMKGTLQISLVFLDDYNNFFEKKSIILQVPALNIFSCGLIIKQFIPFCT